MHKFKLNEKTLNEQLYQKYKQDYLVCVRRSEVKEMRVVIRTKFMRWRRWLKQR